MIDDDLTTGPIQGHFRKLAIPAALAMLFSTLYNIVDTFYAGYFGTQAQAGLAVGFQAFFLLMSVGFGLGSAMSALVGNAKGRKDIAEARQLAAQGIGFATLSTAVLMAIAVLFGPWLIALVSEPGAYRDAGQSYFNWLTLSLPGFVLAYTANGILQARGDTVSMQRALVVAFFANIALNPLLMFGLPGLTPGLGFNGIAAATVLSQSSVAAYLLFKIFGRAMMQNLTWREFTPDPAKYLEITRQAFPTSFTFFINFASGFVVQYALKGYGEEPLAAYGISLRIEQLFLLPAVGITIALVPIAAQNFGAHNHNRVRQSFRLCWRLGVAATLAAFPLMWFGGASAIALFSSDPEVIRTGALFLKVEAAILPLYVVLFSVNSLLQALKQAVWAMWIGIYRQGIGIALFIWLFTVVMDWGLLGVRLGIAVAVATGLMLALSVARHVSRREMPPQNRPIEVTE
ncbi:MAG: MATE family efflux transporter [Sedimentitalea sp.]